MPRRFFKERPDLSFVATAALLILLAIAITIDAAQASWSRLKYAVRNWNR